MRAVRIMAMILATVCLSCAATEVAAQRTGSAADARFDGHFHVSAANGIHEAYLPVLFHSSHAANLLKLHNGDLLCFWFSGTEEGESNVAIVMARLPKGSEQWSKTVEIDHQAGKSFQNPVAFQTSSGRIWLLHTAQTAEKGQADAQVLYLTSDDLGQTWTHPKVLFKEAGSFTRHPPILLSEEKWLLPLYYTPSGSIVHGAVSHYSVIKATRDEGQSWKECRVSGSQGLVQPNIVELKHNSFVAFFRSRYADFIYKSESRDGCTWSVPVATRLPNNNSSIQVTMLKDRSLVLVFNNSSAGVKRGKPTTGPRKPLSVALSKDGGNTWPWVRDIESGSPVTAQNSGDDDEEYSYPSVTQSSDGMINVAYTYLRKTIKTVRFDEDWIKKGKTIGRFHGDR
ncbi:MAG TPA: sialidase family protein [Terriglobales bacterium]|nr:sialidase family protein [Terriglobales bacterium]